MYSPAEREVSSSPHTSLSPVTGPSSDALRERFEAGRAAWPGVEVTLAAFARHLAERSLDGAPSVARAADLYLACACTVGAPFAVDTFRRAFRFDIARAISRTDSSASFLDEVMQLVSVKLFVRTGDAAPAISEYAGRASLRGWVTTVAKRTALNLRRRRGDQAHDEMSSGVQQLATAAGPELSLLKARYKVEFETSIRAAFVALPDRDRSLLLLHLVNGLTLPQLAAMQNVSRATVARWLSAARDALFEMTRSTLVERLRLTPTEYDSVLALVRSQLELSIVDAFSRAPSA